MGFGSPFDKKGRNNRKPKIQKLMQLAMLAKRVRSLKRKEGSKVQQRGTIEREMRGGRKGAECEVRAA